MGRLKNAALWAVVTGLSVGVVWQYLRKPVMDDERANRHQKELRALNPATGHYRRYDR